MRTRNVREIHAKRESFSFALLSGGHCTIAQLSVKGQPQHCKKGYPYNDLPHIHRLNRPDKKMTHHKKLKHCSTSSIPSVHTTIHIPQNKRWTKTIVKLFLQCCSFLGSSDIVFQRQGRFCYAGKVKASLPRNAALERQAWFSFPYWHHQIW